MPQSVTKHLANGVKTSMEHQKLWIHWRRINVASPWFANYANFIVGKVIPPHFTYQQRKKFFYDLCT
jgi:hypothetical protein